MGEKDLSDDAFLGGRLRVLQPRGGFRSGLDAVLLAAAVPAVAGQTALDLGCGAGVAGLCLAARVPNIGLTGLEFQPDYVALATRNAARNGLGLEVVEGDVRALPAALRHRSFDHVLANPPYFRDGHWSAPGDAGRARALGEVAPLAAWVDAGTRRLKPGGSLTMIQSTGRLADLLGALDQRLGSLQIKPIAPRAGHPASLVILRAKKGGRAGSVLFPPLVLHRSDSHAEDQGTYCRAAEAVLRHCAELAF